MYRSLLVLLSLVLSISSACLGAVFHVDAAASGANNGTGWVDAFTNIQAAIDAAYSSGGGEVWVRAGGYSSLSGPLHYESFEAINPNSADIVGNEHTLYFTDGGTKKTVHVSVWNLTGDTNALPPDLVYTTTTDAAALPARFKDLATSNPNALYVYNHPEYPWMPMPEIIACANLEAMHAMEIHGSPYTITIWDAVLANLDDQATGCRKIVWGITADDKHDAANFGFNHYGAAMGTIPTPMQSPVYTDRRLAFKDMMRRGSFVCIPPGAPCGMPRYSLNSYVDGTAAVIRVLLFVPDVAGTSSAVMNFYGCDRTGGDTAGGKLLFSAPVTLNADNDARYFLTPTGTGGTPFPVQERANIKYIRPVLTRVINGVTRNVYFQPVRITHQGKWWSGPDYTLAGSHAAIGASPYPAGGNDTGEIVYFNSHCHTNGSDGTHSPTTVRKRYMEDLAAIDPGKPFFTIITDHDRFVPFPEFSGSVIELREGVHVYGGFSGTETSRDQRDPAANVTVMDASSQGRCVYVDGSAWSDKADASIDGFTLTRGNALYGSGGALFNWHSSLRIRNCRFLSNIASSGGAVATAGGEPVLENCEFRDCDAAYGGGTIATEFYGSPAFRNCIVNGSTSGRGGGIYCTDSHAVLDGTEVADCFSNGNGGGGLYSTGGSLLVNGCRFLRNAGSTMYSYGGGIRLASSGTVTITNSVFAGNTVAAGSYGAGIITTNSATITNNTFVDNGGPGSTGGIYIWNSSPTISNNIIAFNSKTGISKYCTNNCSPVLRNNCVFGNAFGDYSGITPGTGDVITDPLLVSWTGGDYHLQSGSPCMNAGWAEAPGRPALDMDNQIRPQGTGVDIGADEYWATAAGIQNAKSALGDITWANVDDGVVTAAFSDAFYLEAANRACGIRIEMTGCPLVVGDRASVAGIVRTNSDGERCIQGLIANKTGFGPVFPLAMTDSALGGGSFAYQAGVAGGFGLNNIGLLVRVSGAFTYINSTTFTIDDGSPEPVKCVVPLGVQINPAWQYLVVTGISSCENDAKQIRRLLRVRSQEDIAAF